MRSFQRLFTKFACFLGEMNWNLKLDECKSKLKIMFEFKWNLGIFLDFVFFSSFDDNFNEFV